MQAVDFIWTVFFMKVFKKNKVCFFKNRRVMSAVPSKDINGIPTCGATLFSTINIAYLLGYKKIVLVGVDLYDRRYFWMKDIRRDCSNDLQKGAAFSDPHRTGNHVLKQMNIWNKYLKKRGVDLYIYNPRSLLSKVLPLYEMPGVK